MPFDVPITIEPDTAKHVGEPKLRLPASVKACPPSFFSFVHLTTSHGGDVVSVSVWSRKKVELIEALRLWLCRKAGEAGREPMEPKDDRRDWNRRSKGRKDGVGLLRPGREAAVRKTLLLGDDTTEPYILSINVTSRKGGLSNH